ncbi:probable WRKY transcription factor 75 [Carica papaya]|uniref:probable WRKY transcription factor 75 n=1 Tax=Carica papaya TaxID=3649 RepID=UPI000B8D0679|nr:probable WRKY transcription factor 75 [Carica papaya]
MDKYSTVVFSGSTSSSNVVMNSFNEFKVTRSTGNGFLGLDHDRQDLMINSVYGDDRIKIHGGSATNYNSCSTEGKAEGKKKEEDKKMKKQRYAFQTRSRVDILDDGYRWRKYGQKPVKNNKYPRSYYRCTHKGCNVKKQIQRLTKDEGIVVTTYEGIHSHQIQNSTDNFEHILTQMQIYTSFS